MVIVVVSMCLGVVSVVSLLTAERQKNKSDIIEGCDR